MNAQGCVRTLQTRPCAREGGRPIKGSPGLLGPRWEGCQISLFPPPRRTLGGDPRMCMSDTFSLEQNSNTTYLLEWMIYPVKNGARALWA